MHGFFSFHFFFRFFFPFYLFFSISFLFVLCKCTIQSNCNKKLLFKNEIYLKALSFYLKREKLLGLFEHKKNIMKMQRNAKKEISGPYATFINHKFIFEFVRKHDRWFLSFIHVIICHFISTDIQLLRFCTLTVEEE